MIKGDDPIRDAKHDLLGRARLAEVIAGEIRTIDASEGFVVGVLGPWGSGKTSLINLIRNELEKEAAILILAFNPWMFSGADQLLDRFFTELAGQLGERQQDKIKSLAKGFARYGKMIAPMKGLPIAGQWIALLSAIPDAAQVLKDFLDAEEGGVAKQRRELNDRLSELDKPILVVIDDIDRLTPAEIRDIFKLVRLTANFPNIIYLVAFDRNRVEQALNEDGLPGRDYLEKIIQAVYEIPAIPVGILSRQLLAAIDEAIASLENSGPFDETRWPDVFFEVVLPLFRNMRDVRRYAASLPGTLRNLDGRVSLVDVLALEAIRVFLPDLYEAIDQYQGALTTAPGVFHSRGIADPDKERIEALLDVAGSRKELMEAIINRLFPMAIRHLRNEAYGAESQPKWAREKRVAYPDVLAYYFERVASERLQGQWGAESAFRYLADREQFEAYFQSVEPSGWEDVILALEAFQDEFPVEAAVPATIVLLNLMPAIPERPRGMYSFDSDTVVRRVLLRLLRRLPTAEAVETAVRAALPEIRTLSSKLVLLNLVGHEENSGHELISMDASHELEASLRDEIREADTEYLALEPEVFRLLLWTKRTADASEPKLELQGETVIGSALLKGAITRSRTQGIGTRAIRINNELYWDSLVDLVGGEDVVRQILNACENRTDDQALTNAIQLAKKYLEGWRPNHRFA